MPDRTGLRTLLGRLARGGGAREAPWKRVLGETFEGTGLDALIRAESISAEAICSDLVSAADTVVRAGGMALAGRRVSVFVPFSSGLSSRIRGLEDKRVPIVVFVTVEGEDDLDALGATGVPVAVARDAVHALDLALVARRLAESALTPVVVALEPETASETGSWPLPSKGLVQDLLGAPSDPVEPPTAAQRILFGESRRTVPRWFDPDRPVLVGAAMPHDLRAAAEAGRRLYFDAEVAPLLREARVAFERLSGRDLPEVTVLGEAGARRAIVAEGPAAHAAARGAPHTSVVALTWRSPFPENELREALSRAQEVTVLVRAPLRGGDAPAWARAVHAALPSGAAAPKVAAAAAFDEATVGALLHAGVGSDAKVLWAVPAGTATASSSPRREALLQRLRRDVPASAALLPVPSTERGGSPTAPADAAMPPLAVRRFGKLGSAYDNVARYWGENAEPLVSGDPAAAAPDPYLALGAVPPYTAAFLDATPVASTIPVLDPERCTACGRCWASCPDSAIPVAAVGTANILETATRRAAATTETDAGALARLARTLKPVSQRADATLARSGARRLDPGALREAWAWYAEKGLSDPAERDALGAVFERVVSGLDGIPLVPAPDLAPDERAPAPILLLGFDPRSCRGCGTCAAECPETAIELSPRLPERVEAARGVVSFWEDLPDTPGPVVRRAERDLRVGGLAAALLTRHAGFAVAGGGEGEPGSGTRLAARQVLAVVETERQKATAGRLVELERLEEELRAAVRELLADAVTPADMGALEEALRESGTKSAPTADLLARLEGAGERHAVDAERLRRLASAANEIEGLRRTLVEGEHGTGRARYGLVVVPSGLDWATHVPSNPFGVPATVEPAASAPTAAVGLAETLAARAVEEARIVRRARLALENPADLPARESALDGLSWPGLDDDEARGCAPVVVLAARSGCPPASLDGMVRALACGLPVKVALLDDRPEAGDDPIPGALARRLGFVASTSVAHGAHLAESVAAAVRARVPAFVRVVAPGPDSRGTATDTVVARAREIVEAGIAPLLLHDPASPEIFEERPGTPAVEVKVVEVPVPTPSLDAAWLRKRLLELAGYGQGNRS